jgi:serine/threonine protein kinase
VLGKGGFGIVYVGQDPQLHRKVAIKVPHRHLPDEEHEQFLREARRLAQLKHPGVVTVYDVGIQDGQSYIISDLVSGISLKDWLRDHRPTFEETVDITSAVADALSHAHAQGVIHRDVKPSNIVLTDDLKPVLLDFGLAITEDDITGKTETILGTPAYMSPERQARKEPHRIDGRTDIYSLGVILYQMLCGRRPFNATDVYELMRQVREDEPQPPRQRNPKIPQELERICLKAMSKHIGDRHSTASDLAEEIRAALKPVAVRRDIRNSSQSPKPDDVESPGESTLSLGTCPHCLRSHGADATFCANCGAPLSANLMTPSEHLTSTGCDDPLLNVSDPVTGTSRATASTRTEEESAQTTIPYPREPERRQITILYCSHNLNESIALIESLEPAERKFLLDQWRVNWQEAVERYEGTVLSSAAPGLMVCFGYPVAFEDASYRAVQAGLRILKGIAELADRFNKRVEGGALAAWVTIHTSSAVVSDPGVSDSNEPVTILGEARTVATRMEPLAEPGTVVISETVHRLVHGYFECKSLGSHTIKGIAEPFELFSVLRHGPARSRLEVATSSGLTPLVARNLEVNLLLDRWEQAKENIGQTVLIIGEPGIGKSRLVHVIKEHVGKDHKEAGIPSMVEWRCSPFYQNTGLYPASVYALDPNSSQPTES